MAVDDSASVNEDAVLNGSTVLANDPDIDSSALSATLVTGPSHGTLLFNSDGSYTYTPTGHFNGTDSFTYLANDGTADSNVATVTVTVSAVNDAPMAVDDSATVNEDAVLNGSTVLANDTDTDIDALTAVLLTGPSHGTLVFNSDGSYTYTPTANFNGTDSFTYQANDGTLNSNVATITITVSAVNDAPVAMADSATVNEDAVLNGSTVLANDSDTDVDNLTATLVTVPSHGTLVFNSDGSYTYTPTANFNGTDSFTYQANDGTNNSTVATVAITIAPVNDAPVIATNALTIQQGGTAEPLLLVTDVDNANADLLISASDIVGGHFANAGTGNPLTQFTMADVAAHQVVFVHDDSGQAPSYVLSATDGLLSASASTVQASFTLTPPPPPPVISTPPPAPPAPPVPPVPPDTSDSDKTEEHITTGVGVATGTGSAQAAAPINRLSFFVDANNFAPTGVGVVVVPPANQYGVDLNTRMITASTVTAAGEDAFRYSWLKALNTTLSDTENLRTSLNALREQLQNDGLARRHLVASSIAVSTGLSVGYVIWLVRGGALIGSMLSAMPAWQMIDPLPVLARGRVGRQTDDGEGDDASIEHIFDDDDGPAPPPRPAPPPPTTPTIEEAAP